MNNLQSGRSAHEIDGILLDRIKRRDENGLSLLYDRYALLAHSILMRMLRSVDDADDVFQELFVQLWNFPDQYEVQSGSMLVNLITKTRNRGLSRIRTRGAKKQHLQHENPILPLYSDSASLNDLSGLTIPATPSQVLDALRKLSGDEQRVLSLAYYDGYSLEEISGRLKLPAGAVSWALWKSLTDLRESVLKEKFSSPLHEKKFLEACAAHVIDILDAQETIEFKKHLSAGCEICKDEIKRLTETAALIPLGLPHMDLAPELKQRVLFAGRLSDVMKEAAADSDAGAGNDEMNQQARHQRSPEKLSKKSPLTAITISVLSIALIAAVMYSVYLQKKIPRQPPPSGHQQMIERLSEAVEYKNDLFDILASKNLRIIPLESSQNNLQSLGKLFWDGTDEKAVLQVAKLPTTPDHQEYRLWAFIQGSYFICGAFTVKRQLYSENFFFIQIPAPARTGKSVNFFVTLETAGSTGSPRGKRYLSGDLIAKD